MLTDPVFYLLAIPAVALMGLAKGGFSGVGAMSMPLLALAISPVQAAAILLPILIVQDAVSVWAFRRDWDRKILLAMIPGALVGIVAGYLLAAKVSAEVAGSRRQSSVASARDGITLTLGGSPTPAVRLVSEIVSWSRAAIKVGPSVIPARTASSSATAIGWLM